MKKVKTKKLTYAQAGVSIRAGDDFTGRIAKLVEKTTEPGATPSGVLSSIGGFSGLFAIDTKKYHQPVLVSSTDGVGTKLKIAFALDKHDTVGIDLVAMGVNDILVPGAKPMFFLDYLATGKLKPGKHEEVIKGIVAGCRDAECDLIGGETAELPGFYSPGEYDLAGFVVGIVARKKIIDGSRIRPGDVLIGLASTGLHSNGYSLARKVLLETMGWKLNKYIPELRRKLGEEMLRPTRIYVRLIQKLIEKFEIRGIAHITGGGIPGNLPRVFPAGVGAVIERGSWPVPAIFKLIQEGGDIEQGEMDNVFNNGIGMILVVPYNQADRIQNYLKSIKEKSYLIGGLENLGKGEPKVRFAD